MNSKKKTKEIENKKIPWRALYFYLQIWAIDKVASFITFLTQYSPFSLLSETHILHYKNKKAVQIKEIIFKAYFVITTYQQKDQYYFYLYYDKDKIQKEKIREIIQDEDVLINESGDYIKVLIPR